MVWPWGIPLREVGMTFRENWVPGSKVDIFRGRMVRLPRAAGSKGSQNSLIKKKAIFRAEKFSHYSTKEYEMH
jgi:hypothetical protein